MTIKKNKRDLPVEEICIRLPNNEHLDKTTLRDSIQRHIGEVRRWKYIRLWSGYLYYLLLLGYATPYHLTSGLTLTVIGLALRTWASGYLLKNKELCREGPYRYVRHPLYFGSFLVGTGVTVAFGNAWFVGGYQLYFTLLYNYCIVVEERRLRLQFGKEFENFQNQVNGFFWTRFIFTTKDFDKFRSRLIIRNREHIRVISCLVTVAVLYFRSRLGVF